MIPILSLLLIAQALPLPECKATPPHRSPQKKHKAPAALPSPSPAVKITLVNATCVPSIAVATDGTNKPVAYPDFRQGEWTGNAPLSRSEIRYLVSSSTGGRVTEKILRFKPVSSQIIVMTGDLGTAWPSGNLPQLGPAPPPEAGVRTPNFQLRCYPCDVGCKDPFHYRIVNAMPSKALVLRSVAVDDKPARQIALLAPGGSILLTGQPPSIDWDVEVEEKIHRVSIRQEGAAQHCIIPFFLREGQPHHIKVFQAP